MARRGILAELNRQIKIAERNSARSQREAERTLNTIIRNREQAEREGEKARKKYANKSLGTSSWKKRQRLPI